MLVSKGWNLVDRHAHMVEPLLADFLTRALLHRLLDEVTRLIWEEAMHPHARLVMRLIPQS